jgi:sulfur-carrier protein
MITIEVPKALVVRLDEDDVIEIEQPCSTLRAALDRLGERSPGVLDRVLDEQGRVRQHVNIFVDETDIRYLDGLDTGLEPGSRVYLLASVSGG